MASLYQKINGVMVPIVGGIRNANLINYNNIISGLQSTNVQGAIDQTNSKIGFETRINSETEKPEWKVFGADTWNPFNSSLLFNEDDIKTYFKGWFLYEIYNYGSSIADSVDISSYYNLYKEQAPDKKLILPRTSAVWGGNEPWVSPTDYYFTRITQWVHATTANTINLTLNHNDQAHLYMNDVNLGLATATTAKTYSVSFSEGWNKIEMWNYENTNNMSCYLGTDLTTLAWIDKCYPIKLD